MRKYLIFSVFVLVGTMLFLPESIAASRGGASARRGIKKSSRIRLNPNSRTAGVVGVVGGNKDSLTGATNTSTLTTKAATSPLDNQQCVNSLTQCLAADNLCGAGLFECKNVFATGADLLADSRGQSCADKLTSCQCYYVNEPPTPNTDCSFAWDQAVLQINNAGYDMGECQSKFMSCAKTECSGANYQNCVDLIDTAIGSTGNDDLIDTQDFLRDWLNDATDPTTTALSTGLRGLLMQRLARCEADVLTQCQDYDPTIPAASVTADNTISRTLNYFFQDFARKASEGLINYQETHAKDKWLKAEACVDTVDQCMAKHCGEGYKKCLHEDATVDFTAANNFRTLCQKEMITCSEIRVEVGLPGYQFLQNPAVDGVEAVWNEFISKKLVAHGNKMATDRRELERELDKKLAAAQRECDLSGGQFGYTQTPLLNYQAKFGADSSTDDYKGDKGLMHNMISDTDGDGGPDNYGGATNTAVDDTLYGEASTAGTGQKSDRFYDRPTCRYTIVLQRSKTLLESSNNDLGTRVVDLREKVGCNEQLFPDALRVGNKGAILGAIVGGVGGFAGGSFFTKNSEKKGTKGAAKVGGAAAGAGLGAVGGAAIQREALKKKLSCAMRPYARPPLAARTPVPVARFGQPITLPPVNVTAGSGSGRKAGTVSGGSSAVAIMSAFDAVDEFYRAHPDLIVQRGEYRNASITTY